VSAADETLIRGAIAEHIPAANGRLIAAKTCLYRDFIFSMIVSTSILSKLITLLMREAVSS
jgi:hypothetical protein